MERAEALLRVERGHASEEELAALAAVLIALRGSGPKAGGERPAGPPAWWDGPAGYVAPGSWH
ncbi:acyl-CoA carboxylase epsilon subunit [Streptomyces sp. NPDC003456]|uniref:acyl-CoA carboxylase epsilon subunit n=1 Tax=Streptomyces sp. NPDC003456 TaxID=3364683 RepID=UPI0036AAC429